ncbi:hypothetical protein AVEN_39100-1 [Araneus ventricosus]|uniref:Uncharacterized protein n=1 Tax=Araneus ventricosus TaxID=182803 RepID=A0A4Y2DGN5_ARAVE|nr:hypothetical protein AVEN_39100-1 [Araneus ventricosus]
MYISKHPPPDIGNSFCLVFKMFGSEPKGPRLYPAAKAASGPAHFFWLSLIALKLVSRRRGSRYLKATRAGTYLRQSEENVLSSWPSDSSPQRVKTH